MKKVLIKILKRFAKLVAVFVVLILVYLFFLNRDIKKIDEFCEEMKPGLDVNQIHAIADKYGVGFKYVRDANSVKNQNLGIKLKDQENTWFFAVAAPMTIGEHACGVYHNNLVVLSTQSSG